MVNPDELVQTKNSQRSTLKKFEEGTLRDEARDGAVKRRLFRKDVVERKVEEVYLPILIIPGVASSGLVVEKSSLDERYEGQRLWMNPGFLAKSRLENKVFNEGDLVNQARSMGDDGSDSENTFAKTEDELAIKNAWIHHIGLDKNMIDEKPGNRVRPYEGIFGCEYLVDNEIAKQSGWVMAPLLDYCVRTMGYEREKSIDAMPYDWRLAPSINEKRDQYLTKMIARIERMYNENDKLPIVLVCHSMGAKMGHYFLNFAKAHKGQEWLDKYIHTYMPVGAPHGGVGCAVRTGITGKGLDDMVDALVGNISDGLQMYRRWSCGNWLMPRMLPNGVFPTCIVRREGELGVTITSEIEVGMLFAKREKPPKELQLTVVFRDHYATTQYSPVEVNKYGDNPKSLTVSFHETFYLAVPFLGKKNVLGELNIYLEEPGGRINLNRSKIGQFLRHATAWARCFKKKVSAFIRKTAKSLGTNLRVAENDRPLRLKVSDFEGGNGLHTEDGKHILEKQVSIIESLGESMSIGSIALKLSYSPPLESTGTAISKTPIAMIHEGTIKPPIMCQRGASNAMSPMKIPYDVMNGTDMFQADGFVGPMFDLVENVYEGDPIGPTKESSLGAPPVNCVRSIYGINIPTEAGAIYRKVPVVTIGDNEADRRYMVDTTARFRLITAEHATNPNLLSHKIDGGIVYETPRTLQNIPGQTKQRRCCGDGTVPYWNMVHALSWKDDVETLTVDELPGAAHRGVVADERFFALLKRYCKVVDPRANAMMRMKEAMSNATSMGIKTLTMAASVQDFKGSGSIEPVVEEDEA
eukprot:CAMPEP_0116134330 /NCGR_PEP_ID=MMETSP0329-20121206/10587_1 /TAXON_ID=697910 /ORGANISM="Pseudo-nitzschia arenysensis, Strain B593" /LENGTH=808 /DNA_ID=CAMNT_0003629031 /DNA_START=132 /DNA_END=2558 /DNA_ORIENTATION=-